MRLLQDVLVNGHGLNLTGWTLRTATAISDDGLTFSGWGINPNGDTEAWRGQVAIPAPGAALLGLIGMSTVGWVRRRLA